jgi:hypothetical protein
MRRSYLLLSWCALVACASLGAGSGEAHLRQSPATKSASHSRSSRLAPPRYFADAANRHVGVHTVGAHMDRGITLAGHYSQSIVGCGTECWSNWVVDRRTGAIIDVPYSGNEAELIEDVQGRRDSDVVQVIYAPRGEATGPCRARNFRLRGTRFTELGGYFPVRCPR